MTRYLLLSLLVAIAACESTKKEEEDTKAKVDETAESLREALIGGEWRNLSMQVTIHGDEKDSVISVPEGEWENILQIKPITTVFHDDGTYTSEYRTLEDSVFMTSQGTWMLTSDTLFMVERGTGNGYKTSITGDIARFEGYLDWDEDGEADDHYIGKQKKY